MKNVTVTNVSRNQPLGTRIGVADTHLTRLRGLLGKPALEPGEGLLIRPCKGVHMYMMSQSLDVAFLDQEGCVVALYRDLAPWKKSAWHASARQAVELPPGSLARTGTELGDSLRIEAS